VLRMESSAEYIFHKEEVKLGGNLRRSDAHLPHYVGHQWCGRRLVLATEKVRVGGLIAI